MNKEEVIEVFKSLYRIEMLIKVIMQEKYGEKATRNVYEEVVKLINNEFEKVKE